MTAREQVCEPARTRERGDDPDAIDFRWIGWLALHGGALRRTLLWRLEANQAGSSPTRTPMSLEAVTAALFDRWERVSRAP